jgi:hypothetical protein
MLIMKPHLFLVGVIITVTAVVELHVVQALAVVIGNGWIVPPASNAGTHVQAGANYSGVAIGGKNYQTGVGPHTHVFVQVG